MRQNLHLAPLGKRPRLVPVPDEMKQWAALLGGELRTWAGVTSRPMFGCEAYYHRERIFAILPRTRAPESGYSIGVKLRPGTGAAREDPGLKGPGWQRLELESGSDLRRALRWLERAYRESVRGIDRGRKTK